MTQLEQGGGGGAVRMEGRGVTEVCGFLKGGMGGWGGVSGKLRWVAADPGNLACRRGTEEGLSFDLCPESVQ